MTLARWVAALAGLLPVLGAGCGTKTQGQIMLVMQTDMALPKDINRIRVEVTRVNDGTVRYQKDFDKFGVDADGVAIRLPGTINFLAPEDPSEAFRFRVIATSSRNGPDKPSKRVFLREVVTTVPEDRTVTLPMNIEFLCGGSGEVAYDPFGEETFTNDCPEGLTCVAGTCVEREVTSESLPAFKAADVFGGGTGTGDGACFDTATCFDQGTDVPLDLAAFAADKTTCLGAASGEINVALRTEGAGICGATGCFIALDADRDAGWKPGPNGTIKLPAKVCEKVLESQEAMGGGEAMGGEEAFGGKIVGVVMAPVGAGKCQKKQLSVPTCGPWSAAGEDTYTQAKQRAIASGQRSPLALAVAGGNVCWTERGTFSAQGDPQKDGAVKAAPIDGGEPTVMAKGQASPHGLVAATVEMGRQFLLWTNAGDGTISTLPLVDPMAMPTQMPQEPRLLVDQRLQPEGIAVSAGLVYWTELASNQVYRVATTLDFMVLMGSEPQALDTSTLPMQPPLNAPRGITALQDTVCWTYEDKLMTSSGVVACSFASATALISSGERTPRAIALSADLTGATGIYWANFDAESTGGGIFWVPIVNGAPQGERTLIAAEDYPAGLVFDRGTLYWTSRSRGTVMSLAMGDTMPTKLAEGQKNPGAIAVDAEAIYWINEGTAAGTADAVPDGTVMKLPKK
jgi:hypothetical protein